MRDLWHRQSAISFASAGADRAREAYAEALADVDRLIATIRGGIEGGSMALPPIDMYDVALALVDAKAKE